MNIEWRPDGRPQGPTLHILSPLAPTIRRSGPQSPCIVGAGEDVDVGLGPLWLPVRANHYIFSHYLKCIGHCGRLLVEVGVRLLSRARNKGQRIACPPDRAPTRGPAPLRSSPAPTRSLGRFPRYRRILLAVGLSILLLCGWLTPVFQQPV